MKRLVERVDHFGMPLHEGKKLKEAAVQNFLPDKLVMIDLEMTGVVPERDEIIQIAATKLVLQDNQYVEEGEPFEIFPHTNAEPSNPFHKKFLVDIFRKANESEFDIVDARNLFADWLGDWNKKGVVPTGDCIQQDMMFLYANAVIDRGDIVNEGPVQGNLSYECFDINPLKCVARQKAGKKEKLDLDAGIHNALVDCRNQTIELNHYLSILFA